MTLPGKPPGRLRPRVWFIAMVICFVVGLGSITIGIVQSLHGLNMTQVMMPGSHTIEVAQAGTLMLAIETNTIVAGQARSYSESNQVVLSLTRSGDGLVAEISKPAAAMRYDTLGRSGVLVGEAMLEPGTWTLLGTGPAGTPAVPFAWGMDVIWAVMLPLLIWGLLAVFFGAMMLGCLVLGIMATLRANRTLPEPSGE